MPTNLVESKQDEEDWAEARRIVDKQYPDKSPDDKDKSYWKLTTSIYENIKKNRGKKNMQKQASVGELLAGQLKLRKQADGPGTWRDRISAGGHVDTWDNRDPWVGRRRGGGNVVTADKINAGGHVDTLEYRGPGFVKRGGRWVRDYETPPIPRRLLPPTPRPFPIPRGIRGPWYRPDEQPNEQPNNPMDNERIRRLVEGNNAPNGSGWDARPVNDNEIPMPSEDPGGWTPAPNNRPANTPPANPPKMTEEELNRIMRELQRGNGRPRHYDPGWNNEPGWYERMRWPNRFPEVERPRGGWWGSNMPGYWLNDSYYQDGVGRNGEIDPRADARPWYWATSRTVPFSSLQY